MTIRAEADVFIHTPVRDERTALIAAVALQRTDANTKQTQVIITSSTIESVKDIHSWIQSLTGSLKITSHAVLGGIAAKDDIAAAENGTHILVGTPSRFAVLVSQGKLNGGSVKLAIVDRVDEVRKNNDVDPLYQTLDKINERKQVVLISERLSDDAKGIAARLAPGRYNVNKEESVYKSAYEEEDY